MSPGITSATSALIARKGWDTEMEVLQIPVKVGSARLATQLVTGWACGQYRCHCGEVFIDGPDSMSAVACPACGQEADAYNGNDFAPRSQWGEETGESFQAAAVQEVNPQPSAEVRAQLAAKCPTCE